MLFTLKAAGTLKVERFREDRHLVTVLSEVYRDGILYKRSGQENPPRMSGQTMTLFIYSLLSFPSISGI
jgi:hypothetical protein